MAAPPSVNILNMSGTWTLNRQLSDNFDSTFQVQGVSWPIRKILSWAGVTLHMTQTSETSPGKPPVTKINVRQVITPGGFNSEEAYTLDSSIKHSTLPIFGAVSVHSRYVPLAEIEDVDLREKLAKDGATLAIQEFAESKGGDWSTVGVWGFEVVNGERRFTRTNTTTGRSDQVVARLVYDYSLE
ncbi:hypothetical protein B0T16DRAFT_358000 [Cercophora newfieldiana]|uniref:Uncharacterized protein n=1 Tax=Cercophora newfieldiana TaxID=92897 RepID=A0AA40CK68_9PEZI|nr:hypothetical protein B0T16DRAFT_358000 [Cercophora newfieldiana]